MSLDFMPVERLKQVQLQRLQATVSLAYEKFLYSVQEWMKKK